MKKFLAICLTLIMVMGITLTATAAPAGFVSSPSAEAGPELVRFSKVSSDCTARLVITPYSKRNTLPAEVLKVLEEAYNDVVNNGTDLTKLTSELTEVLKSKKLDPKDIAVSDLFDVTSYDCDDHERHGGFDIVLSDDGLKHFVALLHKKDGKWEVVKDAKIVDDHIHFSVDSLSPFAIVVDHSNGVTSPQTGSNSQLIVYAMIMIVSAAALVVVWKKSRSLA